MLHVSVLPDDGLVGPKYGLSLHSTYAVLFDCHSLLFKHNRISSSDIINIFLHLYNCVHINVIFQCSEEVGISWAAVDSCMKSVSGTVLQLLAQQETLKVAPSGLGFVPTITFNKVREKKTL
jgi:hypothetical protein